MESKNMIDIIGFDNYKFDLELHKVLNIKKNKYLTNVLNQGYYRVCIQKKTVFIHKLVYQSHNPTEDLTGFQIDHIDGNKSNNKIENLRKCSASDNCSNRKTRINNKLGIKYIYEERNRYRFLLRKNKIIYTKYFKNLEDAIEYRDIKVKEINGEFANLG